MEHKDFVEMVDKLIKCKFVLTVYPNQYLINVKDADGTIQSYYASKQTAVFRKSNDKDAERKTLHDFPVKSFAYCCMHPEKALKWS